MKIAFRKLGVTCVASALLTLGLSAQAAIEPCAGFCEVAVGNAYIRVDGGQPSITADGFGFKTKYSEGGAPLNGGLNQWQVNGRNLMFSESFWYRIGPASPTNPEHYWVDPTGPLEGTQQVLPGGTVGRIAAGTEGGLPRPGGVILNGLWDVSNTPNGSRINEKLQMINTTDAPLTISVFAYTDIDLSIFGDTARGRFNGGNAEILQADPTGHIKLRVSGLGASGFEISALGGRVVENGGDPAQLDFLNRAALAADFTNDQPQDWPWISDVTHVIEWANIELPAFGSREVALVKEFSVPEPGTLGLMLAPLLAGLMARRRSRAR